MNILVFGAGGQLGSELVGRASSKDISFHFVRRADAYIDDPAAVRRAMQLAHPSLVLNAAAYTNVDQAEVERDEAFRANGEGPKVLAQACAEKGIPLIHISTDYVFDGSKKTAYVESDATGPIDVYGQSKLAGEIAVAIRIHRHVILRTSWVFGHLRTQFPQNHAEARGRARRIARGCRSARMPDVDRRPRRRDRHDRAAPDRGRTGLGALSLSRARRRPPGTVSRPRSSPRRRHSPAAIRPCFRSERRIIVTKAARPQNSELDSSKFFSTFGFRARDWRERTREAVAALCRQAKAGIA